MSTNEVLKLALDDLIAEYHMENSSFAKRVDEIFKEVPAQPQQEPVAWLDEEKREIYWHNTHDIDDYHGFKRTTPLYKAPTVPQRPVGWMHSRTGLFYSLSVNANESGLLDETTDKALFVYTSPPARKPLTDEEIRAIVRKVDEEEGHIIHFARAIEAKHNIKGDA